MLYEAPESIRSWLADSVRAREKRVRQESATRLRAAQDILLPVLREMLLLREAWVFGSVANGKANEESDIDILAIFAEDASDWRERFQRKLDFSARIRNTAVNRGLRYPVDLVLWSEQEKEEQGSRSSDFWREVQECGRRLA